MLPFYEIILRQNWRKLSGYDAAFENKVTDVTQLDVRPASPSKQYKAYNMEMICLQIGDQYLFYGFNNSYK
jgi:hypothetical protein